jgi:serine/threonine protein kinase
MNPSIDDRSPDDGVNDFLVEQACRLDEYLRSGKLRINDFESDETLGLFASTATDIETVGNGDQEWEQATRALVFLHQLRHLENDDFAELSDTTNLANLIDNTDLLSQLPKQLGHYEVIRILGRGGFAEVLLARDPQLDRYCALKIPHPHLLSSPAARVRFQREAKAAGSLRHPHIVPVYEWGELGALCYIAFEYTPGPTLADWMASNTEPVTTRDAASIVARLASAMDHAHGRKVIHRDLKPSNVLVDDRQEFADRTVADRVRVTDFGLARQLLDDASSLSIEGTALGTPAYMSPEQAIGNGNVTTATDVYSLGMILYELLTKELPFKRDSQLATMHAVINESPVSPRLLRHEIDQNLSAICLKCLAKIPEDRYASAALLADDLHAWLNDRPLLARRQSVLATSWRAMRRNPLASSAITFAIVSLLCGLSFSLWQWGKARTHLQAAQQANMRAENHLLMLERSADSILGDLVSQLAGSEQLFNLQRNVLEQTLKMQYELLDLEQDSELVTTKTIKAHMRAADCLRQLGRMVEAQEHVDSAMALADKVTDRSDFRVEVNFLLTELAIHHAQIALDQGDRKRAIAILQQGIEQGSNELMGVLAPQRFLRIAMMERMLAVTLENELDYEQADLHYSQGLALLNAAPEEHPIETQFLESQLYASRGVLRTRQGRDSDAAVDTERASQLLQPLLTAQPHRMQFQAASAVLEYNLGNRASRKKDWQLACVHYQKAANAYGKLHHANPSDYEFAAKHADSLAMLGSSSARIQNVSFAQTAFDQAINVIEQAEHSPRLQVVKLRLLNNYGRMLIEQLSSEQAGEELYLQVLREGAELLQTAPHELDGIKSMVIAAERLGDLEVARQQPEKAAPFYLQQAAFAQHLLAGNPQYPEYQREICRAQERLVKLALLQTDFAKALREAESLAESSSTSPTIAFHAASLFAAIHAALVESPITDDNRHADIDMEAVAILALQTLKRAYASGHQSDPNWYRQDTNWRSLAERLTLDPG